MNPHVTPRPFGPFPGRSTQQAGPSREPIHSQQQHQSQRPMQPQPAPAPAPPVIEEYNAITEEDREHIDEVFDLMDMKKKGYLNSYEFRHSLSALGFDLPKPDYFQQLSAYGAPPPDFPAASPADCPVNRLWVYPDQFRTCTSKLIYNRDPREEAVKVFRMFDYDNDGIISFEDMRRLAGEIKDERSLGDEEIASMIEHLDHDGKGGVNLEEFVQMMEEAG